MKKYEYIKNLINVKSFDLFENENIINYLINRFSIFSKEIIKIKNEKNDKYNLLIGLNTELKNVPDAIVLAGHIDTVVADENAYKTNPYCATEIDGKIYGLGAIDMKSYFACILDNNKTLKSCDRPIVVAITSDEETDLDGVELVTRKMRELNICPRVTIVGEPTSSCLCSRSKSCNEYSIEITGKSCHSSMNSQGINANYIACRIMLYIEALNSVFADTTMSANIMSGGDKINIVPAYAKVMFDLRSASYANESKLMNMLTDFIATLKMQYAGCEITLENQLRIPPLEKRDDELIAKICKSLDVKEQDFVGACEAGYYQSVGGSAIVFGVGDLALAHKPNEFVCLAEFDDYEAKFIKLIDLITNM